MDKMETVENVPFRYKIEDLAADMEVDLLTVSTLYTEYFIEMKQCIYKSKNLCTAKDWQKLERVIHNIKGISNSLNIDDIYNVSNELDNELNRHIYDNIDKFLENINNLFLICEKDIKKFFRLNSIILY
jgi:HPt (histidine-containing phosphotransfer) domain-containing protein